MGKHPKSSILIGFAIIFTIHFGGFPPIFGNIRIVLDSGHCFQSLQVVTAPELLTVMQRKLGN